MKYEKGSVVAISLFVVVALFLLQAIAMNVWQDDDLYGLINKEGKWIVEPSFASMQEFSDKGVAPAQDPSSQLWGFIDTSGQWVIEPKFEEVDGFNDEGYARVSYRTEAKMWPDGYWVDISTGDLYDEDKFDFYSKHDFDDELAYPVKKQDSTSKLWGYVDENETVVIPYQFSKVTAFNSQGLAEVVPAETGRVGLIDTEGKWVIAPTLFTIGEFNSDGLARAGILVSNDEGYIPGDKPTSENLRAIFELLGSEDEELREPTLIHLSRFGVIDASGTWVIEPKYLDCGSVIGEFIPVQNEEGFYGYIDKQGNQIIASQFGYAGAFTSDGVAIARETSKNQKQEALDDNFNNTKNNTNYSFKSGTPWDYYFSGQKDLHDYPLDEFVEAWNPSVSYDVTTESFYESTKSDISLKWEDATVHFDIEYPQVHNLNSGKSEEINEFIRQEAMEVYDQFKEKPEEERLDFNKLKESTGTSIPEDRSECFASVERSYITCNTDELLSIALVNFNIYGPRIKTSYYVKTLNINLETGEAYSFDDILEVDEELADTWRRYGIARYNNSNEFLENQPRENYYPILAGNSDSEVIQNSYSRGFYIDNCGGVNIIIHYLLKDEMDGVYGEFETVTFTQSDLQNNKTDSSFWELL